MTPEHPFATTASSTGGTLTERALRETMAALFREYRPWPRQYDHAAQYHGAGDWTILVVNELAPARPALRDLHRAIFG